MPDEEPKPTSDASRALMSAMFSAGAAASVGGSFTVAATAGASGAAFDLAVGLRDQWMDRRSKSAVAALEQAAEIVGGLDILEERTRGHDERLELTAKVLEAAAKTVLPKKIQALARVLAEGLEPHSDVDEATVLALALDDMEAVHVHVLHGMATATREQADQDGVVHQVPIEAWDIRYLGVYFPEVNVTEAVMAVLIGHGLVSEAASPMAGGMFGPTSYGVSSVGRRCLLLLGHALPPDGD